MNKYTVLFGLVLCMVTVNARHFGERVDSENSRDEQNENIRRARDHGASQIRHKRRSWQMNYGYEYPQPPMYYPDNRREYDYNQQDLIPQILRLLDEISSYVKRPNIAPPPVPQPIYVPYPVPYPVPQSCRCPTTPNRGSNPNVTSRFPEMEDSNQNWGFALNEAEEDDDGSDGSRPISFVPIQPKRPGLRTQPKLEHGSNQAGGALVAQEEKVGQPPASASRKPSNCDVFALTCCNGGPEQQRKCFNNVGCGGAYDNGNACRQERLLAIIDAYSKAYSPVN